MRNTFLLCAAVALPVALTLTACGGDSDTTGSGASTTSSTSTTSGGGGDGSGSTSGSTGQGGTISCEATAGVGSDQIVINEINAIGVDEWVEIANKSDKPVDLCGYAVADSVKDIGGPDLTSVVRFPAGASIPAGGYIIILGNQVPEMPAVEHKGCLSSAPSSTACYYADWKISSMNGEFIFFLTPKDEMITNAEYPPNAVDPLTGGQTWARQPDKTGAFAVSKTPTPGAENKP